MQESNDIKPVKMTKILHFTRLSDLAAFLFTLYYAADIIVHMILMATFTCGFASSLSTSLLQWVQMNVTLSLSQIDSS